MNLGERKKGTLSAYSVFNKNYEKLLGTFDASNVEQVLGINRRQNEDNDDSYQYQEENKTLDVKQNISKMGNKECYCGSKKKYKKCCYWRELKNLQNPEKYE